VANCIKSQTNPEIWKMKVALSPSDLLFYEGLLTVVETLVKEGSGDVAGRVAICIQSNFNLDIRNKYLSSPAIGLVTFTKAQQPYSKHSLNRIEVSV